MDKKFCDFCKPPVNALEFRFEEPWWDRLCYTATVNSTRASIYYRDCEAPDDLLERKLRGVYNQHRHWNKDSSDQATQAETCLGRHGRIMQHKIQETTVPKMSISKTYVNWHDPHRANPFKTDNSITGVHLQETNGGYSRQPDGGFFSI